MFIEYSKLYLSKVQSLIITNQYILFIVFLLEFLPIIYNMFYCAFELSSYPTPLFYQNSIYYISIYDIFRKHTYSQNEPYPFYFLIIMSIFFLSFLMYKYLLLPKITLLFTTLNIILINIYEIVLFRILSIFIYEIIMKELFLERNIYYNIILLLLLFIIITSSTTLHLGDFVSVGFI